jgi:hypothetical protein
MNTIDQKIVKYVSDNIGLFHRQRLDCLSKLKLRAVLKKKNPYLYRVKSLDSACDVVTGIADAHIASNEETIFGDWLEGFAIFVNGLVYHGKNRGLKELILSLTKIQLVIL